MTLLALLGAVVLLSGTMSTPIGEQTQEIAQMKAIGASRRQIRGVYLRTTMLLGALGALVGAALGIPLAWGLTSYFGSSFFAISTPFSVYVPIVVASVALGLLGPPLAASPAIRRAARLPLSETLQATGSLSGGQGPLDRLLRRARFLPRAAQSGMRGLRSRPRRASATVFQVGVKLPPDRDPDPAKSRARGDGRFHAGSPR